MYMSVDVVLHSKFTRRRRERELKRVRERRYTIEELPREICLCGRSDSPPCRIYPSFYQLELTVSTATSETTHGQGKVGN